MASKAAEKATLEAKMRTEQLKRGSEKISTMFGNMREKVEERASEEYEKSDYAQKKMEDIKAAQEGVGTCAGRNYLIDMFNLTSPISWHSLFLFYFILIFFSRPQQKHRGLHRFVLLCKKHLLKPKKIC